MLAAWCLLIALGMGHAQDDRIAENEAMIRQKPRATALLLAEVRADAADEAARAQTDFYLGRCLERIGLLHAAHQHYRAAAQGSRLVRTDALRHLARLAELIGDDEPLIPLAAATPEADYPPEFADALHFLRARHRHRTGDIAGALSDLQAVPVASPRYPAAQLLHGVLLSEQGQPDAARAVLLALTRLRLQGGRRTQRQELARTQALARLSLGRIAYAAQRYPEAAHHYARVSDPYRPEAALEGAWTRWLLDDTPDAARALLQDAPDAPEAAWLAVLLSPPGAPQAAQAAALQAAWRRDLPTLQAARDRAAADPAALWQAWFTDTAAQEAELPLSVDFFRAALRDTRLSGAVVRMRRIQDDLRLLDQQPPEWRTVFEAPLRSQLLADHADLEARAGRHLQDHLERRIHLLQHLLPQAQHLSQATVRP